MLNICFISLRAVNWEETCWGYTNGGTYPPERTRVSLIYSPPGAPLVVSCRISHRGCLEYALNTSATFLRPVLEPLLINAARRHRQYVFCFRSKFAFTFFSFLLFLGVNTSAHAHSSLQPLFGFYLDDSNVGIGRGRSTWLNAVTDRTETDNPAKMATSYHLTKQHTPQRQTAFLGL